MHKLVFLLEGVHILLYHNTFLNFIAAALNLFLTWRLSILYNLCIRDRTSRNDFYRLHFIADKYFTSDFTLSLALDNNTLIRFYWNNSKNKTKRHVVKLTQ